MAADRLTVPRLTSRSAVSWVAATGVAVLAAAGYLFATQPANRWAVLVVVPVLALFLVWLLARSLVVDRSAGRVVSRTLLGTRSAAWAEADRLQLVDNRGGVLLLAVRERGSRRSIHLPVLILTDYVEKSQSPPTLLALAEEIERWAPQRATVAQQLRRQAEHLGHGGSAVDSPLASTVRHRVTGTGGQEVADADTPGGP